MCDKQLCAGHFSDGAREVGRREIATGCDDGSIVLVEFRDADVGVSTRQFCDLGISISSLVTLEGSAGPDRIACAVSSRTKLVCFCFPLSLSLSPT